MVNREVAKDKLELSSVGLPPWIAKLTYLRLLRIESASSIARRSALASSDPDSVMMNLPSHTRFLLLARLPELGPTPSGQPLSCDETMPTSAIRFVSDSAVRGVFA
jgi:hypothetical protein